MAPSAAPPLDLPGVPPDTAAALDSFRAELAQAAGPNLAGLLLYGGLARGRYHPGRSDVNVVVLLHDVSAAALAAVAPVLRAAWRALRVEPMLLTPAEVPASAEAFPTKFLDIQRHHVVLAGDDPFAALAVSRERLRAAVEQSLRNLALRLRRRFVAVADQPRVVAALLASVTRPLAIELESLLRLAGQEVPAEDRTVAVFAAAAAAFGLDGEALAQLAALRRGEPPPADLPGLCSRVLAAVARAADYARQGKGGPA
jgi:hypothetical protein